MEFRRFILPEVLRDPPILFESKVLVLRHTIDEIFLRVFVNVGAYFFSSINAVWRRTKSPGDPTPQRQRAWLLSTYLTEGEEQKEVLETKDDEEKESEVDGEVEERVTQRVHET